MKQRRRRGFLASDEGLKKLDEKMLQKGYTQEKLVEVASVSLDQVKKLLNPHWGRRIQKDAIREIARVLELQPVDIVESSEWYPPTRNLKQEQESTSAAAMDSQSQKSEGHISKETVSVDSESFFSQIFNGSERDLLSLFGWEDDPTRRNFVVGQHIDKNIPICLDLDRLVERSNGVFGDLGTGKTSLTRLLLSGIIRKQAAVNLIFDLHSEYGWEAVSEEKQFSTVKGLRQLFPGQVEIYTLDPESTKRRGVRASQEIYISYDQIEIEDLRLIGQELNLSEASLENAVILRNEFGKAWIERLLNMTNREIQEFCETKMGSKSSIMVLQRKLLHLDELKYMRSSVCQSNSVSQILKSLEAGKHVVIEFGTQSHPMSYMLATNVIVRRIHGLYLQKTEKFLGTKNPMDRPRQLVITLEDAHRFLSTSTVRQTIFNTIADKGRKNSISLLVVDQRPSKIDIDFMSQLGSFITAFLDNQKDIDAICAGVSGNQNLRSLLAKLDAQQQALLFGHAVPKPTVVNTRSYDLTFYDQMGDTSWEEMSDEEIFAAAEAAKADLGF
jgi:hypothetical protein